jgi:hypothetical protein
VQFHSTPLLVGQTFIHNDSVSIPLKAQYQTKAKNYNTSLQYFFPPKWKIIRCSVECCIYYTIWLSIAFLNVIKLNVIWLNVIQLNVIRLNIIRLNVIRLNVIRLNVIRLNVIQLNVIRLNPVEYVLSYFWLKMLFFHFFQSIWTTYN